MRSRALAVAAVLGLAIAACGDDTGGDTASPETTASTTTTTTVAEDAAEPARLLVVLGPSYGPEGYETVDMSTEEPWASLRD